MKSTKKEDPGWYNESLFNIVIS